MLLWSLKCLSYISLSNIQILLVNCHHGYLFWPVVCCIFHFAFVWPHILSFFLGDQRLIVSIRLDPDNFLHFWVLNPLNKIKQQQKSKPTPHQKKSKEGKVEDFPVQISSFSDGIFCLHSFFGVGKSTFVVSKRQQWNCTDLYCSKHNRRELKLHLSSNGAVHTDVDFLLNVCLLGLLNPPVSLWLYSCLCSLKLNKTRLLSCKWWVEGIQTSLLFDLNISFLGFHL